MTYLKPQDLEALSAYLDDALNARDRARLEARLQQDPALRKELESLRHTRQILRATPQMRAPRNFTLTPEMAGAGERGGSRLYFVSRFAFTLASLVFVVALAGNLTLGRSGIPAPAGVAAFESAPLDEAVGEPVEEEIAIAAEGAAEPESIAMEQAVPADAQPETTEEGLEAMSPPVEEPMAAMGEETPGAAPEADPAATPEAVGDTERVTDSSPEDAAGQSAAAEPPSEKVPEQAAESAAADHVLEEAAGEEAVEVVPPAPGPWLLAMVISGAAAIAAGAAALVLRRR